MASFEVKTLYLGPEASFSHQAAVEALPTTRPEPRPSFAAILRALQEKQCEFAVLPVENSTNGSVVQAWDLLALCGLDEQTSQFPDVEVVDEHYLEVHHCLFVRRAWAEKTLSSEEMRMIPVNMEEIGVDTLQNTSESTQPSIRSMMEKIDVRTLFTHPQVWGQCNKFLTALLPPGRVERIDMGSTSAAAAFVVDNEASEGGCNAAISSVLAGEKHANDLVCIAKNIEDEPGANTTRFLVLRNKKVQTKLPQRSNQPRDSAQVKSLWAFTVTHHQAGALAKTLAVFAKHDYNLSAIQSRPKPKSQNGEKVGLHANWQYVTFVECLHSTNGSSEAEVASRLLEDLNIVTEQVVSLGSWKDRMP